MDNATQYLVAVPQPLADAARLAAATWDPAGADSMFRNPTLHPIGEPENLYVFSYGWIGDAHIPAIQAAATYFPRGKIIGADTFADALALVDLERVIIVP